MPSSAVESPTKRKRGRPCRQWLKLDEVARILAWDVSALARLLKRCPGALSGAIQGRDGWEVPERALRALLGAQAGPLPQCVTCAEIAEALRVSTDAVYKWTTLEGPDGRALLPARFILGRKLVLVDDVLKLPPVWPTWAPARPASFSFLTEEVDHG